MSFSQQQPVFQLSYVFHIPLYALGFGNDYSSTAYQIQKTAPYGTFHIKSIYGALQCARKTLNEIWGFMFYCFLSVNSNAGSHRKLGRHGKLI
jgi:hypothetical protein